jgi:hypothetical protein
VSRSGCGSVSDPWKGSIEKAIICIITVPQPELSDLLHNSYRGCNMCGKMRLFSPLLLLSPSKGCFLA